MILSFTTRMQVIHRGYKAKYALEILEKINNENIFTEFHNRLNKSWGLKFINYILLALEAKKKKMYKKKFE